MLPCQMSDNMETGWGRGWRRVITALRQRFPAPPITRETKRAHPRGLPGWRQAVEEGRQMGGPRRQVHVTGVFQRPRDWREGAGGTAGLVCGGQRVSAPRDQHHFPVTSPPSFPCVSLAFFGTTPPPTAPCGSNLAPSRYDLPLTDQEDSDKVTLRVGIAHTLPSPSWPRSRPRD